MVLNWIKSLFVEEEIDFNEEWELIKLKEEKNVEELIEIIANLQLRINNNNNDVEDCGKKKYHYCWFNQIKYNDKYYVDLNSTIKGLKRMKIIGQ